MTIPRYVTEFLNENKIDSIRELFLKSALFASLVSIILSFLYLIIIYFNEFNSSLYFLNIDFAPKIAALISINLFNDIAGRSFLAGLKRRDYIAFTHLISRSLFLITVFLFSFFNGLELINAINILLFIYLLEAFFYLSYLIKNSFINFNFQNKALNKLHDGKRVYDFAKSQWKFRLIQLFREYSVDNYMLLILMSNSAVGIYSAATTFPTLMRSFSPIKMFSAILLPSLIPKKEILKFSSFDNLQKYFELMQKINAVTVWPIAIIGILISDIFLNFAFGSKFSDSTIPMIILIFFTVYLISSDVFYNICIAIEKPRIMYLSSYWGIANLLFNLTFIPIFGPSGAALGTGITSIFIYNHFKILLKKDGLIFVFPWKSCLKVIIAATPLFIILTIKNVYQLKITLILSLLIISYILYLTLIRIFSPFTLEEKILIKNKLGKISCLIIK